VTVSFSIQIWSHHNAWLASFLKTAQISVRDCLMLLAVSTLPLLVLEVRKVILNPTVQ
jgi:Ca2+-transporting ATPase